MINRNQVFMPINLRIKIADDDPVIKLVEICETIDYRKLCEAYIRRWRKTDPITMFILIVYGYMTKRYSARAIEEACRTDIRFMWILGNNPAPDHATIARFQNERLAPIIEDLFYQFVEKLIELGEVSYTNVFIDGTKIEANANKYSFVWAKAVKKNLIKLNAKIEAETRALAAKYGYSDKITFENLLDSLMLTATVLNVTFVRGKGKQ